MRGKKRPPEDRMSSVAGPLPPCRVCGEQAAGFHYGVNTCEACKGFFRRSLLRDGKYECVGTGNCVISTSRRKSCPKCRYLRCLSVGMSKEAIKTGRYTYMKRTQDTLELKMLKQAKQRDVSDVDIKIENSSESFEESASYFHESKSSPMDGQSCRSKSPNKFTSAVAELINSPVSKPPSPAASTSSQSLTELLPTLSAELMSTLPSSSQHNSVKVKRIEELKSREGTSGEKSFRNFSQPSVLPDSKVYSPLSSTLLSPLSLAESCEFSPGSQKFCHGDQCYSKTFPSSTEASPMLSYSPLPSPVVLKDWYIYSDSELDDFITDIVLSHRMNVEDSNSIADEVLQKMFKECKERCSLKTEIFGHLGIIKRAEHDQVYASTGLDVDGRLDDLSYAAEKMDVYVRQMIAFMKLIPGFRSLRLSDQTALVQASIYDLFLLGYYRGYNREEYMVVEPSKSYCRHQMEVFQPLEDLDRIFAISQRLQNLHLTFEMIIILKALCVFFPDRAILEEPENIEQLQFKMAQSLLLLLRRHYSDQSGLMFGKIISVLMQSRNYAEHCHKFIMTQIFTGSYMERFHSVPILIELFSASDCS